MLNFCTSLALRFMTHAEWRWRFYFWMMIFTMAFIRSELLSWLRVDLLGVISREEIIFRVIYFTLSARGTSWFGSRCQSGKSVETRTLYWISWIWWWFVLYFERNMFMMFMVNSFDWWSLWKFSARKSRKYLRLRRLHNTLASHVTTISKLSSNLWTEIHIIKN